MAHLWAVSLISALAVLALEQSAFARPDAGGKMVPTEIPAAPASASQPYLDWRRAQLARIVTIGFRISAAAAQECPGETAGAGLIVEQGAQFQPADALRLGFDPDDSRPRVAAVARGSPAERAGIAVNDILDIWPADSPIPGRPPTFAGVERAVRAIDSLPRGPASPPGQGSVAPLHVVHAGASRDVMLELPPGCGGWFDIRQSRTGDAVTNSAWIQITDGLLELVPDDDRLAFVLGHEMAHRIIRHRAAGSGRGCGSRCEFDADRIGLELAIRAGYAPWRGPLVLETLARKSGVLHALDGSRAMLMARADTLRKMVCTMRPLEPSVCLTQSGMAAGRQ